jgi:hypothetical protein
MNPVPPEADTDLPDADESPPPGVSQDFSASGQARQAVQGSGVQHIYFDARDQVPEPAISIAPPVGQWDESLPIRGRDELLSELAYGVVGSRVWVIHGLGGAGKTRLALEAAFTAQQRGTDVWWVSAVDADTLVAGIHAVGRRLGIAQEDLKRGDAADIVWQRLAGRQQQWLLVIDGADDPQVLSGADSCLADGRGWLRPVTGQAGLVVVTSRDGSAASWGAWCQRRRLEMLPATEAAAVLADHAGSYPRLGSAEDARLLAMRLGGLPLALKIAGSYLASSASIPAGFTDAGTITTYRGYREAMDAGQPGGALTQPSEQMTQVEVRTLIGRTWELTLDRLDARHLPEARKVLQLLAIFADAAVPYELLLNPSVLAASTIFPGLTGSRLWQIMTSLEDFGLIELSPAASDPTDIGLVRLHPLVRDTSRSAADPDDRTKMLALASKLLEHAAKAQKPYDPASWPALQLLVPHIEDVFQRCAEQDNCPKDVLLSVASAAHQTAQYRSRQGLGAPAESLYRAVLEVRTQILGPDNSATLETRHQFAHEIARRGDHTTAETEHRAVLEATTRSRGPDSPQALLIRHCLAHEISARGDHATAEAEHRAVLEAETRILGPDNPQTLRTRHCLADEISARGDHATAEAEHQAVLEAETRVLGPDDPETLRTRYCLAHVISRRGDHATAEAELRAVLETQTRILGPDNPDTLRTRHSLAYEIAARGDHAKAEAEYRAVLEVRTDLLGPDSPSTLGTRHQLAHQISARGDHATAEAEHRAVLEAETRILGPDNPNTLATRCCLAREISAQGDHATAEAELRGVLEAETRVLGPDSPSTLGTRHQLAHQISAQGDHATAEAEHRAVLEAETRILGPDNPRTLATRCCLAREISVQGDHATAEAELRGVLEAETRVLGPDSPSTLGTRQILAEVCQSAGRLDESISQFESLLADCKRALGSEHSLTRTVRAQAAGVSAQHDI